MYILLTNDDGIFSSALECLKVSLEERGHRVTVVAPMEEQSGVGMSITYRMPLRVKKVIKKGEFFGYGVWGTPADCVKLAVKSLLNQRPDWVISGINNGFNYGFNVLYSGTVAGAIEGAIQEVPSLALSTSRMAEPDFTHVTERALEVWERLREMSFDTSPLFNVNLPLQEALGTRITRQSTMSFDESYQTLQTPFGEPSYWLGGHFDTTKRDLNLDICAVTAGYISITPLQVEKTCLASFEKLQRTFSS